MTVRLCLAREENGVALPLPLACDGETHFSQTAQPAVLLIDNVSY